MTTQDVLNRLEEMRHYFSNCYINASKGSEAEKKFQDYTIVLDIAWMAVNQMEDDGK